MVPSVHLLTSRTGSLSAAWSLRSKSNLLPKELQRKVGIGKEGNQGPMARV